MRSRRQFIALAGAAAAGALADDTNKEAKTVSGTGFISDELYLQHDTGAGHPERPARYSAVLKALKDDGVHAKLTALETRDATFDELKSCHSEKYLQTAKADIAAGKENLSTGDTAVCAKSWDAAVRAAGGVLQAVDAVVAGKVRNAFCAVRPPGHHATINRGMGFCVLNNIAVAARYAQQKHKLGKILIVDWDVHHGNGTQDMFYEDDSVLFFSTHQSPWYPGTGAAEETGKGRGLGFTLNSPLPAGSGRKEVYGAFTDKLAPAAQKFKPNLVLISAGFDSRIDDPLGKFTLSDDDFRDLTKLMLELAREHCQGRVVSVLEGGYNLDGLAKAVTAHVNTLNG